MSKQTLREVGELLLNSLEVETGLIEVDRSEGFSEHRSMVRFKHRTFQEHLAACHYAEKEGVDELLRHVTDPSWSKVLALACGVRAQSDEKDVRDLLKWMLKTPDFPEDGVLPCATLVDWAPRVAAASACLAELASYDLDEETLEPARRAHDLVMPLLVGTETKIDIQTRARIADGLGSIFDPRLKPDLRWVKVPSGWFVQGSESEEAWIQERPRTKVFVDDFLIQRWPVTVGEYRYFLERAAGYEADAWWLDVEGRRWRHADGIKAPLGWEKNRSRGNCPVTGVSWWEARAFCRWYNTVNSGLPPGWRAELPLEAQWEKAARGPLPPERQTGPCCDADERRFPWGNEWKEDTANCAATGLQHVVAVGLFPAGHSPYGLWDMSGNISEHCQDIFGPYRASTEENPPGCIDAPEAVVRGGSFASPPLDVRVTYRFGLPRDVQDEHVGFRCVAVPGIDIRPEGSYEPG